jgi:hypothetical protein
MYAAYKVVKIPIAVSLYNLWIPGFMVSPPMTISGAVTYIFIQHVVFMASQLVAICVGCDGSTATTAPPATTSTKTTAK